MAALLADLSVTKSHSRPHVSDDNPYSESHFKTMKYQDDFPARFGCIEDARAYCQTFFPWYNMEHRHSGMGYMTPHSVHYGHAKELRCARASTLEAAFLASPNRFKGRCPQPPALPTSLDQPTPKGVSRHPKPTTLHSKFMKPGVAKSLTRSGSHARAGETEWRQQAV